MLSRYDSIFSKLRNSPQRWLVTGAAGFIGSHLVETLLSLSQEVVGLDNFITGSQENLDAATRGQGKKFSFIEGDIRDAKTCVEAVRNIDIVLHQAALGSVPRSIAEPELSHAINVNGFMNMLLASKSEGIKRFVYASSSACYGDSEKIPQREGEEGKVLSPYAATKAINDIYAQAFAQTYGFPAIGLRYFNVFGPRQSPDGPYAAVIPLWIDAMLNGQTCYINGDGNTTRDFCYVQNVVEANILAAATKENALGEVLNIATGSKITLNDLFRTIQVAASRYNPASASQKPVSRDFRDGDIRHSLADITKAENLLGYMADRDLETGIQKTVDWFASNLSKS